jgi:hypothetical protein
MSPKKETPGRCERPEAEANINPASVPSKLSAKRQDVLERLDILEALSFWKLDLQRRLWRTQQTFLLFDADINFGPLANEVRAFLHISKTLLWLWRAA